jgi:hypothetical protein
LWLCWSRDSILESMFDTSSKIFNFHLAGSHVCPVLIERLICGGPRTKEFAQ